MRRTLVAVFGRNDATPAELDAARRFGAAIARAGAVVLTGGVGNGAAEIKEQAIVGAGAHPWIGMENSRAASPPRPVSRGLVLSPGVGHRRNFLLACLCDAAVVLPGEHGTASELLFALALGRPVAAVGRAPQSVDELRVQAQLRIPRPDAPRTSLDVAIAAAYDSAPHLAVPTADALDAAEDDVVSRLLERAGK